MNTRIIFTRHCKLEFVKWHEVYLYTKYGDTNYNNESKNYS